MRAPQPHRALQVLLLVLAALMFVGGLLLLLGSDLVTSSTPWLVSASVGFSPMLLKVAGAVVLTLAYLSYAASHDPVRYVAFIDALAFLLVIVSCLDLYGLWRYHIPPFYPAGWVIFRVVVRVVLATVLQVLRPRGVDA